LHHISKADDPRFFNPNGMLENEVIAAVHFTLRVPCWPGGAPRQFHSLVATAFFTWTNFNSIYDGDNRMKEKDDDIAHPGMVSKPKNT